MVNYKIHPLAHVQTKMIGGLTISDYAMMGACSVFTKDVSPHVLVYGNPAKQYGYVCECGTILNNLICPSCNTQYDVVDNMLKKNSAGI